MTAARRTGSGGPHDARRTSGTLILIRPVIPILAWSLVLAVPLNPAFQALAKTLGGRLKFAAA